MYEVTVTDQTHCRGLHQFLTEKKPAPLFVREVRSGSVIRSPGFFSLTILMPRPVSVFSKNAVNGIVPGIGTNTVWRSSPG